ILEAPLARQRNGSLNIDRQRQAARRVGRTLDAPFDLRRPVAQYVVDARQLVRIDSAFGDAALARELERIQPGTRMRATRDHDHLRPDCELPKIDAAPADEKRRIIPLQPQGVKNVWKNNEECSTVPRAGVDV